MVIDLLLQQHPQLYKFQLILRMLDSGCVQIRHIEWEQMFFSWVWFLFLSSRFRIEG